MHLVASNSNANAGDVVRFTIMNQATGNEPNSPHDFLLCGDGPTPKEQGQCQHLLAGPTGLIQNDHQAVLTSNALPAGDFAMYCDIPGHAVSGMSEVFHVAGAGGATEKKSGDGSLALLGTLMSLAGLAWVRRHAR